MRRRFRPRSTTERGRRRRRQVRVNLDEVRRRLGMPTTADRRDWQQIRELLEAKAGESTFAIWLEPVELIAVDDERSSLPCRSRRLRGRASGSAGC